MEQLHIRQATMDDLDVLDQIFQRARAFMRAHGNDVQWQTGPTREDIVRDIESGHCHVVVGHARDRAHGACGEIEAVFFGQVDPEPTYAQIDGAWIDDTLAYVTIHRLASRGRRGGMTDCVVQWCKAHFDSVRIDTHASNDAMRRAIERNGFQYCGVVEMLDGTPRLAYQWVKTEQ